MHKYQLTVLHKFEAFCLGIELTLIQQEPEPEFDKEENDEATIYIVEFEDEDQMYSFDKLMRSSMSYLFE